MRRKPTKEEYEIFNTVIHDQWDKILINTEELYKTELSNFYKKLPMELPKECPDYSQLETK